VTLSAPKSITATLALFTLCAGVFVLARPERRQSVRALLFGGRVNAARVDRAGPLRAGGARSSERSQSSSVEPAIAAPLPQRWSARAPTDRSVFAIEDQCDRGPSDGGASCDRSLLAPFFARLSELERGQRPIARLAHIGDSIVADDKITARLRQRMQREFGDGGWGWLYAQRPTHWYHPRGVRYDGAALALTSVVDGRSQDERYGPGAAAFDARSSGATATVTIPAAMRVRAYALAERPASVRTDNGAWVALVDGAASLELVSGAHTVQLRGDSAGARLFGLSVESGAAGAIVDNLGLVGSSARSLAHQNFAHWEQSLRALSLDLAVITLGTNDSSHGPIWPAQRPQFEEDHLRLYALLKRATGACLVMLPPDTAEERGGPLATRMALSAIIEAQRSAARRAGCAVWDTFRWMGGRNSIVRWRSWGLADGDYTHLTDAGATRIADARADALLEACDRYHAGADRGDHDARARDR